MSTVDRRLHLTLVGELARRHVAGLDVPAHDLTPFELSVLSQNGEDGVLAELLRRIGPGAREFVEFGIETGIEGTCVALADVLGWSGLFMEGDELKAGLLAWKYRDAPRVRTAHARITAENVDSLFAEHGVSAEPDVVSIDIDGNDLWVWSALTHARPRIVVIEYNAALDHARPMVQPYDPDWSWGATDWFGASLAALDVVAEQKGYRLVHTDLAGVNAFYLREDLLHHVADLADAPRRSVNYDGRGNGHQPHPGGGRYVEIAAD